MIRLTKIVFLSAAALTLVAAAPARHRASQPSDLAAYVNPLIGTSGNGFDGGIDDFPGADAPFGMVQFSPDTPSLPGGGGYLYNDTAITDFSLTHLSGPGCNVFGDVGLLPTIGAVYEPQSAKQSFSHASETATAGYYAVAVGMPQIDVRLTVTQRTGLGSFTFPGTPEANVLINPSSDQAGVSDADIRIASDREVTGYARSGNFCGMPGRFTVYYALRFNRPFVSHGMWLKKKLLSATDESQGVGAGGWVTFDATADPTVKVQCALSWVSVEGAERNLRAEAKSWDVDAVRSATAAQWSSALGRVAVEGGTETQKRVFYTALYHAMLHPNVFSDVDGTYRGFDDQLHHTAPGHVEYGTFSGWDIYRTQIPLVALLQPEKASDMMRSLLHADEQMGWLPKWSLVNVETGVMGGDPPDPMIAGAYAFGARDFDAREALAAMVKGADTTGGPRGQGWYYERPGLEEYLQRGYVTSDHTTNVSPVPNGASLTLEYAVDDFSIAQLARALGDDATYRAMMARAQNWSNVFDSATGWMAPRGVDGAFVRVPIGDSGQVGFQEGTSAQYTWMVPQNLAGLIAGMGGRQSAIAKLDAYFSQIDAGSSAPHAWMGNEPSIGSPWVYLSAGEPWKAQRVIRDVLTQLWGDTPDGIPGNDDLGTMSAWYVWCSIGLYPQNPAVADLDIGAPLFRKISIRVPGRAPIEVTAQGASPDAAFVESVRRNGRAWSRSWTPISGSQALHLDFIVGTAPNERWATAARDAPPSFALGPVNFPPSTLAKIAPASSGDIALRPGTSGTVNFALTNGDAASIVTVASLPKTAMATDPMLDVTGPTTLERRDDNVVTWQAQAPAGITVTPAQGNLGGEGTTSASVRVNAATNVPSGIYDIVLAAHAASGAALQSTTIPVVVTRGHESLSLAYVANSSRNSVTPIDPRTHAYGEPIAVGKTPRALALSADGARLYVANAASNDVSVIDTASQHVIATVKVGSTPWGIAVAPDHTVWVSNHDDNTIQPIDAATLVAGAPISVGLQPESFAFAPDGSTLYVSENQSKDVMPVDLRRRLPLEPIAVGVNPRGIAISPDGKTLFVVNQGDDTLSEIDVATGRVTATLTAGSRPRRIAVSPDGKRLYVADTGSDSVTPIDLASGTLLPPIQVGDSPYALTFASDGSLLVLVGGSNACVSVDVSTGAVSSPIRVGGTPLAIAR